MANILHGGVEPQAEPRNRLHYLPAELRARPQWFLAGADKAPLTVRRGKLVNASVNMPGDRLTFEQVTTAAATYSAHVTTRIEPDGSVFNQTGLDVGYVLTAEDPYTCVDLDVKTPESHPDKPEVWTTHEHLERQASIVATMASYTERSRSGLGLHVWVLAESGRGYLADQTPSVPASGRRDLYDPQAETARLDDRRHHRAVHRASLSLRASTRRRACNDG